MDSCIFCRIASGEAASWKVLENDDACAFFDVNPASEYHTLVIPKVHYADLFAIPERTLLEVTRTVKAVVTLFERRLGLRNIQLRNSSGQHAQQDVFHVHFHLLPRREGDGLDAVWPTRPELREQFDEMLEVLASDVEVP